MEATRSSNISAHSVSSYKWAVLISFPYKGEASSSGSTDSEKDPSPTIPFP